MRRNILAFRLGLLGALALLLVLFVMGCGGSTSTKHTPLSAILRGDQEATPVNTTASGTAMVTVNQDPTIAGIRGKTTLDVEVRTDGLDLSSVSAVVIQSGKPGVIGQPIFTLYRAMPGSMLPTVLTTRLTVYSFTPPLGSNMSYDEAINDMLNGQTYVNVLTQAHGSGEIRGQIGTVALQATLTGQNAIPPVVTAANGSAVLQINNTQNTVYVQLNSQGLSSTVTGVSIRLDTSSQPGPTLFSVYSNPTGGLLPSLFKVSASYGSYVIPPADSGITTFSDAINAMITGKTYLVVQTSDYPDGIIRGLILPHP